VAKASAKSVAIADVFTIETLPMYTSFKGLFTKFLKPAYDRTSGYIDCTYLGYLGSIL